MEPCRTRCWRWGTKPKLMAALPGRTKWLAIMFKYNFIYTVYHPGEDELSISNKNKQNANFRISVSLFLESTPYSIDGLYNLQLEGYGKVENSMVRSINLCSVIMDCVCSTSKLKEELVMYWKNYSFATVWLINGATGNSRVWAGTMSNPYNTDTGFSRFSTCKTNGCLLFLVLQSFSFSLWSVSMHESPTAVCVRNASRAADEVQADLAEVQDRPDRHLQMTCGWFEVCMIHMYIYIYMIICV